MASADDLGWKSAVARDVLLEATPHEFYSQASRLSLGEAGEGSGKDDGVELHFDGRGYFSNVERALKDQTRSSRIVQGFHAGG